MSSNASTEMHPLSNNYLHIVTETTNPSPGLSGPILHSNSSPGKMADPPSSPPHQLPMHTRKRSRAHLAPEPIPSSDPAFFSSDDAHDASVENYQVGRRKKVHTGPWWAQQKSAQEEVASQARKGLSRQPDSGVWLGSDSTEDGVLDDRLQFFGRGRHGPAKFEKDDQELPESTLSEQEDQTVSDGRNPPGSASRKDRGPPLAPNEVEAREIIDECLERGTEVIDLSYVHTSIRSSCPFLTILTG